MLCLVSQLCPTLCYPMDCSPPASSVHGVLQARMLEWATIPFSRGTSRPRDQTWLSCTAGRFFTNWAIREACFPKKMRGYIIKFPKEKWPKRVDKNVLHFGFKFFNISYDWKFFKWQYHTLFKSEEILKNYCIIIIFHTGIRSFLKIFNAVLN